MNFRRISIKNDDEEPELFCCFFVSSTLSFDLIFSDPILSSKGQPLRNQISRLN